MGKRTLFNRLVGRRQAIVDSTAGTTRDRHYGKTDWNGKEFSIIDTGGYTVNSEDIFEDEIRRQVILAIEEADVILFLVEVATGITDLDMMMADMLRRSSKKVLLVCNKVDNNAQIYAPHEFSSLGLGAPYCISSMSGNGAGLQQMISVMRNGGKISLLGISNKPVPMDMNAVIMKGLTMQGIYGRKMDNWHQMSYMVQGGLDLTPVITHRFHYTQFEEGFAAMSSGKSGKVILDWSK